MAGHLSVILTTGENLLVKRNSIKSEELGW